MISSTYKQRRAKLNLKRDMKWNGPHDEEFFRYFDQYLDVTIKKFADSTTRISKDNTTSCTMSSKKYERTPNHFKVLTQEITNTTE